jgi:hypothetical protein
MYVSQVIITIYRLLFSEPVKASSGSVKKKLGGLPTFPSEPTTLMGNERLLI